MSAFRFRGMALGGLALVVMACGNGAPQTASAEGGEALLPSDPDLAELYEETCMACHGNPDSGAPMTGDVEAWDERLAKGDDVIMDNVIDGFNGMPPLGSCTDCTEEDFLDLIEFMATGE